VCLSAFFLLPVHTPTAEDIQNFNRLKLTPELLESARIIPLAPIEIRTTAFALFFLLGIAAGFYSVPLLTFLQLRPPPSEKGRVFATVNWFNWVFILFAAICYGIGISLFDNRANLLLALLGGMTLLTGMFILPGIFRRVREERPDFVYLEKH
jgi:hypothetical protein